MLFRPGEAEIYSPHLRSGAYLEHIAIADQFWQVLTISGVPATS